MYMSISAGSCGLRPRHVSCWGSWQFYICRGRSSLHLNHFISKVAPVDEVIAEEGSPDAATTATTATTAASRASGTTAAKDEAHFRLAVKDNIATLSLPTTCGSKILLGYTSPYEATVVTQLRRRGARLVGKTNLDEFGMGTHSVNSAFGPVLSPCAAFPAAGESENQDETRQGHRQPRSAGGSSGGSAVAVATGEADVALGTDTGGSVRLPAAYMGVVGFKPSYGMLSRHGVVPYANSLDTVGLLSRSVGRIQDLIVRDGLWREHDPLDPTSLSEPARLRCCRRGSSLVGTVPGTVPGTVSGIPPGVPLTGWAGLTFGVPLEYNIEELEGPIRAAWVGAAALVRGLGARVVPVSLPSTRHALSAYYVLAPAEASSNLAKYDGVRYGVNYATQAEEAAGRQDGDEAGSVLYFETRGAGFGDEVKRRILLGSYSLSSEAMDNYFVQAQRVRRLVRRDFDRVFLLENPLLENPLDPDPDGETQHQFDLADLHEDVPLEDKRGPARVDFLLCPTAPTLAPTVDEVMEQTPLDSYMNDVFTVPASLAGLPSISVPLKAESLDEGVDHNSATDLRHGGLQLIGQYWDDARLLQVARMLRLELARAGLDPRAEEDERLATNAHP